MVAPVVLHKGCTIGRTYFRNGPWSQAINLGLDSDGETGSHNYLVHSFHGRSRLIR